jgi:hypothetical protein
MKRQALFLSFLIVSCVADPVFAKSQGDGLYHDPFDRTVAYLTTDRAQRITRITKGGIDAACTMLPTRQILAVGWEINNPGGEELEITPADIRIFDRIREYGAMTPGEAAQVLYGSKNKPWTADPFLDAVTPSSYIVPSAESGKGADDVIMSAFNFGKTGSGRRIGLTYYPIYGRKAKLTATIKIRDETLAFNFD